MSSTLRNSSSDKERRLGPTEDMMSRTGSGEMSSSSKCNERCLSDLRDEIAWSVGSPIFAICFNLSRSRPVQLLHMISAVSSLKAAFKFQSFRL